MMNEYFFSHQKETPIKKLQTSGSFGFKSSQFSQKSYQSIRQDVKDINPSFFNESSIKKLDNDDSGQFIYFKNDSVLSGLDLGLENKKKSSFKQQQNQKKKKESVNYSGQIQFQDSLQKSHDIDSQKIKEYGTGKSNLPPTLKKPKFGFKTSQTAQSSVIIKDAQVSIVVNDIGNQYQLQSLEKLPQKQRNYNLKETLKKQNVANDLHNISRQSFYKNQNSISSIKKPNDQPSIISKSLSQSNQLSGSMNFKSVFKNKVDKASSLYKKDKNLKSNNSLISCKSIHKQRSHNDILSNEVKIAELKDLRQLQNQLGKLKHQNKKIIEYMIQKDQQIEQIKKKKIQRDQEDPYAIVKQNQLMKAFLNNKSKNKHSSKNIPSKQEIPYGTCLRSARSLKQMSLKKSSQISSLHDYDIKQHKFKVQEKPLTKNAKKMILSNRGVLLSQKYLDVGYSLKDNIFTIYFTVKKQFLQLSVKLQENSFVLSGQIEKVLKDLHVGKQIKFKTQIKSTKCQNPSDLYSSLSLKISILNRQKFENQMKQYKVDLPISVYNISKQIQSIQDSRSIQKSSRLSGKQIFKTQAFISCKEMIRDPQKFLIKFFPLGTFSKQGNIFYIGFLWKQKQDFLKIRIKQRSFVIEGEGNPNNSTFQLLRNIVSLLIEPTTQE